MTWQDPAGLGREPGDDAPTQPVETVPVPPTPTAPPPPDATFEPPSAPAWPPAESPPGDGVPPWDATATGAPPAPPPGGPTVAWAPPSATPAGNAVPGAPGLVFAGTLPRFLAYVLDLILIGLASSVVLAPLGFYTDNAADLTNATGSLVLVGLEFLYFVGLWTSGSRATLGMRLFHIQVGNAFDGRTLTIEQAVKRWVALGAPLTLLGLVPGLLQLASTLQAVWSLALLVSTVSSPTKQGLHDRFANSALVQPAGNTGPAMACLLLFLILLVLPFLIVLLFLSMGGQMADILSAVGDSI